ncbi:MAG TPA: Holliday junction resolvase-like protein [Rectinemataceae bacterium]|nr:Holliday junction resolvase-like protein [Rectinemataceae bacterium]
MNQIAPASEPLLLLLAILAVALLVALFVGGLVIGLRLGRNSGRLEAERGLPARLEEERGDAVRRSRAVLGGQLAEQIAPYLPGFPFDPGELRFIGKPVDFLAFVGASRGMVEEVAFIEVKTGLAGLSKVERSLRDAVKAGRVRWVEDRAP